MANDHEEKPLKPFVELGEPSEELYEWARENINEDPDKRDQAISELRDLIFARGECTPHRTDDAFLLRFLRARHFVIKKAHRLLVNYYEFKETSPQYFKDVELERMRALAKNHIISVPPYRDQLGRRMLIQRIGLWDPTEFSIDELFQLTIGILEIAIMEPQCQITGGVLIFDLSGMSISQAWQVTPTIAKHIVQMSMTSFPLRLEAIHVLFQSWVFEIAYNLIRPLVPETVKDKIIFHGNDLEGFHSHIDPKHLPKRYGGIHLDYSLNTWFEDCIMHDDHVIDNLVDLGYKEFAKLKEERAIQKIGED